MEILPAALVQQSFLLYYQFHTVPWNAKDDTHSSILIKGLLPQKRWKRIVLGDQPKLNKLQWNVYLYVFTKSSDCLFLSKMLKQVRKWNTFKLFMYLFINIELYGEEGGMHAMVYMRRSEDISVELVFSTHLYMGTGDWTQAPRLVQQKPSQRPQNAIFYRGFLSFVLFFCNFKIKSSMSLIPATER